MLPDAWSLSPRGVHSRKIVYLGTVHPLTNRNVPRLFWPASAGWEHMYGLADAAKVLGI